MYCGTCTPGTLVQVKLKPSSGGRRRPKFGSTGAGKRAASTVGSKALPTVSVGAMITGGTDGSVSAIISSACASRLCLMCSIS